MSDESLRRAGRAELDRLNAGAQTPAEAEKAAARGEKPKRDIVRRYGPKGQTVDDVVSEAVDGAKLSY
jgi:hypothetical protein